MEVDEYFEPLLTETDLTEANQRLAEWLIFYNLQRPHQSLNYKTPIECYNNNYQLMRVLPMYLTYTLETFFRKIIENPNISPSSHQPTFDQIIQALQESGFKTNLNWRQTGEVFIKSEPDLITNLNFNKNKPPIRDSNFPPKK
ncbi:MAG: hypothetical protein Fur009_4290 [Candidatus Microgenomates bacterium]